MRCQTVEGGYKQIVIAAAKGSEAALAIFEDLINPYWKNRPKARGMRHEDRGIRKKPMAHS